MPRYAVYGAGSWGTIANIFFTLAAIFSDILLIRAALVLAYIFLIISASLGLPSLPHWGAVGGDWALLPWGMLMWSCIDGALHLIALTKLLWEERRIRLQGDVEQLWRCLYRRSGMGRLEFLEVLRRGQWTRFQAGQTIYLKGFSEICLNMVVDGVVEVALQSDKHRFFNLYSGEMFDFRLFNLFGIYIGFDVDGGGLYQVNAKTDCLLYTWSAAAVSDMACNVSPVVAGFWRNLVLQCVGTGFTRRGHGRTAQAFGRDSNGELEDSAWLHGQRTRDMTLPLRPHELPPSGWRPWLLWLWRSTALFPPIGIRHSALPASGMKAAARTLAFANQDHIIARFNEDVTIHGHCRDVLTISPNPQRSQELADISVPRHVKVEMRRAGSEPLSPQAMLATAHSVPFSPFHLPNTQEEEEALVGGGSVHSTMGRARSGGTGRPPTSPTRSHKRAH
ncbi:hypothetical protein V8C86DRAFT_2533008 [Haematococcus lacustris]